MFTKIKRMMLLRKIKGFKTVFAYKYILALKTIDGKIHYVGKGYNYTTLTLGEWLDQLVEHAFLTDEWKIVPKQEVVSIEFVSVKKEYFLYTKNKKVPNYFSIEEINKQRELYDEFIKRL